MVEEVGEKKYPNLDSAEVTHYMAGSAPPFRSAVVYRDIYKLDFPICPISSVFSFYTTVEIEKKYILLSSKAAWLHGEQDSKIRQIPSSVSILT